MESSNHDAAYAKLFKPTVRDALLTILMWLGIIIIIVWVILKLLGYIHSPPWQEVLPFIGVAITFICGAYKFGIQMGSLQESQKTVLHELEKLSVHQQTYGKEMTKQRVELTKLGTEFNMHVSYYHGNNR